MTNEELAELEARNDDLEQENADLRDELQGYREEAINLRKAIRWMVDNAESIIRDGRDAL